MKEAPAGMVEVTEKDGTVTERPHNDIFDCQEERECSVFKASVLRDKYGKYHIPHDTRDATHYKAEAEGEYVHPHMSSCQAIKYADSPTLGTGVQRSY